MLQYFLENKHLPQVTEICIALNKTKEKLISSSFENPKEYFNTCEPLFVQLKELAVKINDEKLANAQFVFRNYFLLFCDMLQYFELLKRIDYKNSWVKLQDCLDNIKHIGRFVERENRIDLNDIYDLLTQYESLYPYSIFCSGEYVISQSHCSICGKSMQSLDCPHIKGNLYWGELAIEYIDKIDVVQAISIVSNPKDKRCILELTADNRTEEEKFLMLHQFLQLNIPNLHQFSIEGFKEQRIREEMKNIGRKQPCPCGSGKRFKHCCGKDMYYDHIRYVVTPTQKVNLAFI